MYKNILVYLLYIYTHTLFLSLYICIYLLYIHTRTHGVPYHGRPVGQTPKRARTRGWQRACMSHSPAWNLKPDIPKTLQPLKLTSRNLNLKLLKPETLTRHGLTSQNRPSGRSTIRAFKSWMQAPTKSGVSENTGLWYRANILRISSICVFSGSRIMS